MSTALAQPGVTYTRFMTLSGPRTGSTLLQEALNSSPEIHCFGEIFNDLVKNIDYRVDGYDMWSDEDMALRSASPVEFLRQRIFCRHAEPVRAVGFKFHYGHFWFHSGLMEALRDDRDLAVIHLTRRNLVRVFVSDKIAERTRVYRRSVERAQQGPVTRLRATLRMANLGRAVRRPTRALARVLSALSDTPPTLSLNVDVEELRVYLYRTRSSIERWAEIMRDHPTMEVAYEDMAPDPAPTFERAQAFLRVTPRRLAVVLERQNPQPLRMLIENFDEVHAALRDTPDEWMLRE